ncbi:MAG: RES family NAD+ phosphorylase [Candidatus Latescibacteria bacterium]|nr:RES family NAD+ phosphorylase [Candidatus Latescibacterota bacterium]
MMASYVNLIGRIEAQIRTFRIAWMFRVINQRHAAAPLNAIPAPSRFSDPAGNYAVLYGAETVPCCLWEVVVRNRLTRRQRRVIPRSGITYRLVVSFQSQQNLNLVDLRGDGPIRVSVSPDVVHDSNHLEGRSLSADVHAYLPDADGFLYHSRFTGHWCCAIFDRAFDKLDTLAVSPLTQHADFWDALNDYDITLTIP